MKIDRVTTENQAIFSPIASERVIREEKQTLTADAVTFDGNSSQGETRFTKKKKEDDNNELPSEDEASQNTSTNQAKKRLVDIIV